MSIGTEDSGNKPSNWPEEIKHTQESLEAMSKKNPHFEDSWTGDLLTIFFHVFPPSKPNYYIHRPQYNLRVVPVIALKKVEGKADSAPTPRTSLDSHGTPVSDKRVKPGVAIEQGIRGSQNLVALVEIKATAQVDREGLGRFHRYCQEVAGMGKPGCLAHVLLIAGGRVYHWENNQLPIGVPPTMKDLKTKSFIDAHSIEFLQLLTTIRDDHVGGLPQLTEDRSTSAE